MPAPKKHRKKRPNRVTYDQHPTHKRPVHIGLVEATWAASAILVILGTILAMSSSHKLRIIAVWVFVLAVVIGSIAAGFRLTHELLESPDPASNELDKATSPALKALVPTLAPTFSRPENLSPSPTLEPLITPVQRVASLSLDDVRKRISAAINSPDKSEYEEVRNALAGLRVDWTLNFMSAKRDSDGKTMQVWLRDPDRMKLALVWTNLPLAGNERLPLMEETDVFRIRGIIAGRPGPSIYLRDAELEYVRSDAKQ